LRVSFDDPEKGMTEIPFATRDTPEAVKRAIAEQARRRQSAAAARGEPGEEKRGGLFGWLRRG
jgi:molecular chaperone DnaK